MSFISKLKKSKIIRSLLFPTEPPVEQEPQAPSTSWVARIFDTLDGSMDQRIAKNNSSRKRSGGDICAIFVHAGAGFHSVQNERIHLGACEE